MTDRKIEPRFYSPVEFDLQLKPYQTFTLDNHTPVYTVSSQASEVARVEFVFYAGNWFEEKNLIAATTSFLIKNGTSNKNAFEINEGFDFEGAYLTRACYNETATITLHCLTKHVSVLLPLVTEILTDATFPEKEITIYQQNRKQQLSVNLLKCDFVADRLLDEYLYGFDHPYGRYTRMDDIDQIQQTDLVAFYQQYYTKGNCIIFASGNLPKNLDKLLNTHFGSLLFQSEKENPLNGKSFVANAATQKEYHIINDKDSVQGAVRVARLFPNRHHPDFQKTQVLNTVFGGYFGSRLMSNIREEKGYTYGISSYLQGHMQESAWVISTEARRDACPSVLEEIWKEAQLLQNEKIEQEELDLVRNYMIGSILSGLDGAFSIMDRWKSYILNGFTGEKFEENIEIIKTVSAEDLQALANKYLNKNDFYELTVI